MFEHMIYAVISNDVALTPAALLDDQERLRASPADGARAWGLGSVQDRRALVKRRPQLSNRVFDFAALASDVPSRVVVGTVVGGDGPPLRIDAIPPFRFQNWVMAPQPTATPVLTRDARQGVREMIPDHVQQTLARIHAGYRKSCCPDMLAHIACGQQTSFKSNCTSLFTG